MKDILKITGYIAAGFAILALVALGYKSWLYLTADFSGDVDAHHQIQSGNSKIQNYDHFFDLCSAAQTQQTALQSQERMLDFAESSKERSRIRANIVGMEAQLHRMVNQYNVDVQKTFTIGQFRDNGLPQSINATNPIYCE